MVQRCHLQRHKQLSLPIRGTRRIERKVSGKVLAPTDANQADEAG